MRLRPIRAASAVETLPAFLTDGEDSSISAGRRIGRFGRAAPADLLSSRVHPKGPTSVSAAFVPVL